MALADWQIRGKKAYLGIGDIALRLPKLGGNLQAAIASAAIGAFAIEMPNPELGPDFVRTRQVGQHAQIRSGVARSPSPTSPRALRRLF